MRSVWKAKIGRIEIAQTSALVGGELQYHGAGRNGLSELCRQRGITGEFMVVSDDLDSSLPRCQQLPPWGSHGANKAKDSPIVLFCAQGVDTRNSPDIWNAPDTWNAPDIWNAPDGSV